MAGKAPVFASRRLHFALDRLSKNFLIDLVVDLARKEVGEHASDEAIADHIQEWIGPISRERKDRPLGLVATMVHLDASDEAYRNKTGRCTQVD